MIKVICKILNYAGYLVGCTVLGDWFGKMYYGLPLFRFISDADYAEEHPKMYLLKVAGVIAAGTLLALAIVWFPLTKAMKWIDDLIEKHFEKKEVENEDKEWE